MTPNDDQDKLPTVEISFREIYLMIYDRWILGLSIGVVLSGFVLVFFLSQQKLYKSSAVLLIESQRERIVNIDEVHSTDLAEGFSMEVDLKNHERQMNSRTFMERIIGELTDRQIRSILDPYRKPGSDEEPDIFSIIKSARSIKRDTGSQIFIISFRHPYPKIAAYLANLYVNEYIKFVMDRTGTSNVTAMTFLENRADDLKLQLAQTELELQEYREKNNMISIEEEQSMTSEKVKTLNATLTETEVELLEISTVEEQIQVARAKGRSLSQVPYIAEFGDTKEILSNIEKLEAERKTLSEIFLKKHPKMVINESRIEAEYKKLENMIELALIDLEKRKEGLLSREKMLTTELKAAELDKLDSGKIRIEYNVLERKVESIRRTYDQIITRLQETQVASQLNNTNIRIVDKAIESEEVAWPNYKMVILISGCLFGFGMFAIPIVLGVMDDKVKDSNDAELYLKKDLMGMIPKNKNPIELPLKDEDSGLKEAFNGVYKHLKLTSSQTENTYLITSTCPNEGKSFIAHQLAYTFAKHGNPTLLVDCDFRKPVQHSNIKISNNKGILNWLHHGEKDISADHIISNEFLGIYRDPDLPFYLLPAGGTTKSPTEFFESKDFDRLFSLLKTSFETVIIDSPPVGLFPDALFLSDYSNHSLFVCKHKHNSRKKVLSLLQRMDNTPSKVRGLIYNMVTQQRGRSYYDFDYYGQYSKKDYNKYYKAS